MLWFFQIQLFPYHSSNFKFTKHKNIKYNIYYKHTRLLRTQVLRIFCNSKKSQDNSGQSIFFKLTQENLIKISL